MSGPPVRRDLGPLFDTAGADGIPKMAASTESTQPHAAQQHRPVLTPPTLTYAQATQGPSHALQTLHQSAQKPQAAAKASTGSTNMALQEMSLQALPTQAQLSGVAHQPSGFSLNDFTQMQEEMFLKFSSLLEKGLATTAHQITNTIKADLSNIGSRIEAIEEKVECTVSKTNQNAAHLQSVQEQLDVALSRIDELENRSRRYNFRIRGLPETFTDIPSTVQDIISEIIPNIPSQRLELDRAHRSLGPPRQDGSPRDIIVKPHFFATKEEVMRQSRQNPKLQHRGHQIQIFADLAPSTIQRRRTLKPLLLNLSQRDVKYRWTFPFAVKFTLQGKTYSFSSFPEGEKLLLSLKLISQEAPMDFSASSSGSTKRPPPGSPVSPLWNKNTTKRSKEGKPS